jgi:4-hydroxyphenylacetate 3-monooxygenase
MGGGESGTELKAREFVPEMTAERSAKQRDASRFAAQLLAAAAMVAAALAFRYEMFYAGAQFVTAGHSFRTYGWGEAGDLVDRLLASFSLEATVSGAKQ